MPSRRILLLVLVCVSFVGFFVVLKNYQGRGVVKNKPVSALPVVEERDTDGDGLKDWEEVLYGTDPNNKDTDGNGIDDKKEVENKTLKLSDGSLLPQIKNSSEKSSDLSETDKITRNIFYDYLVAKSNNGVTSSYLEDLSKRAADDIFAYKSVATAYKKENLKVVSGTLTQQSALQYANGIIVAQKMYPVDGNDLSFTGISTAEDPAFPKWALKISAYYENMVRAFLSVPVPSEFLDSHLKVVNVLSNISNDFKVVSAGNKDPMTALSALPRINVAQKELETTLGAMRNSIETRGIIFSNELGLYITKPK